MNAYGLARALRELARVPSQIAPAVADAINERIADGFASGVDPYGNAWAPLAPATLAKGRTPPPLTESGGLAGGTYAAPMGGAGVALHTVGTLPRGAPSTVHMTGTAGVMPSRPFLPNRGLPATWRADIQRVYSERFGRVWRGGK